jgi:Fe-S oxidoreductase
MSPARAAALPVRSINCSATNSTARAGASRGRIYLIKQMLEEEPVTQKTQLHLDRCLSCRNCETTCPSGVTYHALLDIGRAELERRIERPLSERLLREGLRRADPAFGGIRRAAEDRPRDAAVSSGRAWT